jgi:hypothetical protein
LDFTSQAFFRDPAAGIERLRASGPLVKVKFPIVGTVWITTTHELAAQVLKDSETFTLRKESGGLIGLRWGPASGRSCERRRARGPGEGTLVWVTTLFRGRVQVQAVLSC